MADYYTPTVVDPVIPLAAILPIERLFLAQVFAEDVDGETAYYFSEDGPSDLIFLEAEAVRAALDAGSAEDSSLARILCDQYGDAILGEDEIELDECCDLWAEVLQDIVRRSADLDHLTVTKAYTCSKMRPGGFGGLAMLITAATIRSESTNTLFDRFYAEAMAAGEISHGHT
ncbi:MAG: hypothetical protein ABJA20_10390 [Novosphingobium sp.]